MTVRTLTIIEEGTTDELQLFLNSDNKIYLQLEDFDSHQIQSFVLTKDDAVELRDELTKLIKEAV